MKILILEDSPQRISLFKEALLNHSLWITKSPKEANKWLSEIEFDIIFLDHDLADIHYNGLDFTEYHDKFEDTGMNTAKFLRDNKVSVNARIYIHSMNIPANHAMRAVLSERNVVQSPFIILKGFLKQIGIQKEDNDAGSN